MASKKNHVERLHPHVHLPAIQKSFSNALHLLTSLQDQVRNHRFLQAVMRDRGFCQKRYGGNAATKYPTPKKGMRVLNVAESRDMAPIALHYPQAPSKPQVIPARVKDDFDKLQEQANKDLKAYKDGAQFDIPTLKEADKERVAAGVAPVAPGLMKPYVPPKKPEDGDKKEGA